jgi:hypothetical protein
MEKRESHRECITASTSKRKKKKKEQQDLRVKVLKKNMLERFHSEEAASYAHKSSPIQPEPNTGADVTVGSRWARDADNDLRALLVCERGYQNTKAGAEAPVIVLQMRERSHKGYHYSSEKETRKRQLKRKNTDATGGPPSKRRKVMLLTFISENSEDTVQAFGNTTSSAHSDLPKIEEIFSGDDRDDVLVLNTSEDFLMEVDALLNNFIL